LEQVYTQLERTYLTRPVIIVNDDVVKKEFEDITVNDFDLIGYFPHMAIRAEMSV
jgi:thymidylate synthase